MVGRDFPPFEKTHARISLGTMEEMQKAADGVPQRAQAVDDDRRGRSEGGSHGADTTQIRPDGRNRRGGALTSTGLAPRPREQPVVRVRADARRPSSRA